jgi:hypothetical protein
MNRPALTLTDRAALREEALRRAHELRSEAFARAWNALFRGLVRVIGRTARAALASAGDTAAARPTRLRPPGPAR